MSTIIYIVIVLIVSCILVCIFSKSRSASGRPIFAESNFEPHPNDKAILVNGPIYSNVKDACYDFCDMYNVDDYVVLIKLIRIDPETTLLLFPYEIDFLHFVYLVNHLQAPTNQQYHATVTGWLTTRGSDKWINARTANKRAMLTSGQHENDQDRVYFITMDGIAYQFTISQNIALETNNSPITYTQAEINIENYEGRRGELIAFRPTE